MKRKNKENKQKIILCKGIIALIKKELFSNFLFYIIISLAIPTIFLLMKSDLSYPDGIGYFLYIRSFIMDRDLSFLNDLAKFPSIDPMGNKYFHYTQNGYISSPFAIGTPILWIPFFLFAHILTWVFNLFIQKTGYSMPSDGYSYFYLLSIALGSCIYGILSLFLSLRLCLMYFSKKDAFIALLAIWFSSPFVFCFYYMPNYSHLADSFVVSIFLLMWIYSRDKKGILFWFFYGLSFGLCMLVRWQNALLGILLFIPIRRLFIQYILFALGSIIAFSPQLIVWKIIYGSFFLIPQGEGYMLWTRPEILNSLFSSWHGLYSWTPIILFSTIGLFLLYFKDKRVSLGFLIIFLLQIYVNSCVADWWAGLSFSARRLVGCTPIFILGLACFLSFLRKKIKYALLATSFFWSFILIISMMNSADYLSEYRPYSEILKLQIQSILNLKNAILNLISFSPFKALKEFKDYNLDSIVKVVYVIFGCLLFLFSRISYKFIINQFPIKCKKILEIEK